MKGVLGALAALAGAAAGAIAGGLLAMLFAKVTNASNREGAVGYFVVAVGILGALVGAGVGVFLFARSAPAGQGARFAGSALLGLLVLFAAVALAVWAWVSSREVPAKYGGTQASLELELRVKKADALPGPPSTWLDVEVQTATTRPAGTVLNDRVREEGEHLVVPVVQNPLFRSSSRLVVVRVSDRQIEVFTPPWKAKPEPRAGWSSWYGPRQVDRPFGQEGAGPAPRGILELRYRLRLYGE